MRKSLFSVVAALSAFGAISPALAEDVTISVSFEDLDLTDDADVALLEKRIVREATRACRQPGSVIIARDASIQCRDDLIAAAAVQIEQLRLAAAAQMDSRELALSQ